MKKVFFAVFALICVASVQSQNKEQLCKKWRIDVVALLANMPEEVKAMVDMMPAEQKDAYNAQMKKMGDGYVKFNQDGTMISLSNPDLPEPKKGVWKFVDDGAAIWSKMNDEEKETTLMIIELSGEKLVLKEKGKEESPAITFKKF